MTPAADYPLLVRYMRYVRPANPECLLWVGGLLSTGYGQFGFPAQRGQPHITVAAHRVAWEWTHGAITDELTVDHLCGQRLCVNPDHLEPVTNGDNVRRAQAEKRRRNRARLVIPPPFAVLGAQFHVEHRVLAAEQLSLWEVGP